MTSDGTGHPLATRIRPTFEDGSGQLRVVDLFAGCGGLTLGVAQAARQANLALHVGLAVDMDQAAASVYSSNFPSAQASTASVETFFDGDLECKLSIEEQHLRESVGPVDVLLGGPPCQGHSDLNNRTRRADPKNTLYARMARAAEVLRPNLVIIENVPAVQHDKGNVVGITASHLKRIGYAVASATVRLHPLGVPQSRKRFVLLATRVLDLDPHALLARLANHPVDASINLEWAIGDLVEVQSSASYDLPPRASKDNLARMEYLLKKDLYDLPNQLRPRCHQDDHSYKSMYGRLRWDLPAQTITSGYSSIGQGRYMHPSQPRALTGHEAARIQGFPDYFDFSSCMKRAELATMIGNAVPPQLSREIVQAAIPAILRREVIHHGDARDDAALTVDSRFHGAPVDLVDPVKPKRSATA